MSNVLLWKAYNAGGAIAAHRIVKFGSADGAVVQSTAAGDTHIGVSGRAKAANGARVEIARQGIADVEYGAAITRGVLLSADSDGKAVSATGSNRVIGVAEVSGADGDIGQMLITPSLH